MSLPYTLVEVAEKTKEAYKTLSWHVLETEKALVRLELDMEECQAQKDHGMVAVLRGECERKRAYLAGLRVAEYFFNE